MEAGIRTVPVKLDVSDSDAALLHHTISHFLGAANHCVYEAWIPELKITSKQELHERTYETIREYTPLPAQLVQQARNRAVDAINGVIERWREGKKASKPAFSSRFISYDQRSFTVKDDHATLATVDGRVRAEFILPNNLEGTPHGEYLLADDREVAGGTLHHDAVEECFYLHVRTKPAVESETPDAGDAEYVSVLGIDLGIENIAVASTGRFWSGGELNHWHHEYEKRRGSLQECGTRWAHENVQCIGRRETGRFEQFLHTVSKEIVAEAVENDCTHVAFEELKGIRERLPYAKAIHKWAFHRLTEYVAYKAEEQGIKVVNVSSQYTSQRCSRCRFTHADNRPVDNGQDGFACLKCEYDIHADYNAAKNIGLRYLRARQKSGRGGAPVGVRLNSGTLNASGEYSPTALSG